MKIGTTQRAPAGELLNRYRGGDPFLFARLGGDPSADSSIAAAIERCRGLDYRRQTLREILLETNQPLDASETCLRNIDAIVDEDTFIVATGQQPGFLTGPIYTLYKAASTVALARELSSRTGVRFIPLFWVASDDHDLGEIEGCSILTSAGEIRRFRVDLGPLARPSALLPVPAAAEGVVQEFLEATSGGPHRDAVQALVRPRAGELWSEWFGRILLRLFSSSGLVLFEPRRAHALIQPLLQVERAAPQRIPDALRRGAECLRQHGLEAPLPTDNPTALFHIDETGRRRRVAADPGAEVADLSADAALRPAIQSLVLPTPAVVGGPGELAYWLQLTEAFDTLGAPRPLFYPRLFATIIEARVRRAIDSLKLEEDSLFGGEAALLEQLPVETGDEAERYQTHADGAFRALELFAAELAAAGKPVSRGLAQLKKVYRSSLDKLVRQAVEQARERDGVSARRVRLVANSIAVGGKPQERLLNGLPFAVRSGVDLFDRLAERIDPFEFNHRLIEPETKRATHG